jgi:hypothetical protein
MMFNIKYTGISAPKELEVIQGEEVINLPAAEGKLLSAQNAYAYLFEWNEYLAPGALYELQAAGINARVSTDKFTVDDGTLKKEFGYGTILIPASVQSMNGKELFTMMESVAKTFRITIYGVNTGMTTRGIDLGSSEFSVLKKPVALMFVGDGAVSSDAGEIWHMFDTRYKMPVTMVTDRQFNDLDLDKYNVLIITGSPSISPGAIENIRSWNKRGGTIIAYESGNSWLAKNKLAEIEINPAAESNVKEGKYMNRKGDAQVQQIPGSIFETILDLSHPLCYGYINERLPVFKSTAGSASKDKGVYNNPVVYSSDPLLSGYCSKENIAKIKGTVFAGVHGSRIISIYDNTNFRAITYGTNKIFMNAVFFGQIL